MLGLCRRVLVAGVQDGFCEKLSESLCLREPKPVGSTMDPPLAKAGANSLTFSVAFDPKHLIPAKGIRCL